jgi:hypothetical protein
MKKIRAEVWLCVVGIFGILAIVGIYMPFQYQTEVENNLTTQASTNTSNRVAVVHQVLPAIK